MVIQSLVTVPEAERILEHTNDSRISVMAADIRFRRISNTASLTLRKLVIFT